MGKVWKLSGKHIWLLKGKTVHPRKLTCNLEIFPSKRRNIDPNYYFVVPCYFSGMYLQGPRASHVIFKSTVPISMIDWVSQKSKSKKKVILNSSSHISLQPFITGIYSIQSYIYWVDDHDIYSYFNMTYMHIWMFPKIVGFPPNHPIFNRCFPLIYKPSILGEKNPLFLVQHPYIHAMGLCFKIRNHHNGASKRCESTKAWPGRRRDGWPVDASCLMELCVSVENKENTLGKLADIPNTKKHMKKKTKHANMLEFCPYNQNPISTYAQLFARSAPYLFNVCNLRLCTSYFTLTKNRTEHVFMSSTVNGLVHVQPAPAMAKPGPRACALLRRCPWKKTSLIRPYQGTRVVDIRGGDLSGGNRSP